jgi:hypothetical protein
VKWFIYYANPIMDGELTPYNGEYNADNLNDVKRVAGLVSKDQGVIMAVFFIETVIDNIQSTDVQPQALYYKGEAFWFEGIS